MSLVIKRPLNRETLYNPIAYWLLDESSGVRFDITNNNLDLYEGSSIPNTIGKLGYAVDFNANDNTKYLENTSISLGSTFSISCWIKLNTVGDVQCFWGTGGTNGDFITFYSAPSFALYNDNSSEIDSGLTPLSNVWYHSVCTFTSNEMRLYINGNLINALSQIGTNNSWAGFGLSDFKILGGHNFQINGAIDEVGIWDIELSQNQIQNIYNLKASNLILKKNSKLTIKKSI